MRFMDKISSTQLKKLKALRHSGGTYRERERAHAIILSHKGYSINQLADIFEVDRDSISSWFNRWEESGIEGLSDNHRSGRPPIFFEDLKKN